MDTQPNTDAQTIIALATLATSPIAAHTPFLRLPNGGTVESLEQFQAHPSRIRAGVNFRDVDDFVRYVLRYKSDNNTMIFHKASAQRIDAALDYHGSPDKPSWSTHCASVRLCPSTEWALWAGVMGSWMGQLELAEFLEKAALCGSDTTPEPAVLLEAARHFQAIRSVNFRSAVRVTNGDLQLTYEQISKASVGEKGTVTVPDTFHVHAPYYRGGSPADILIRLYWRLTEEGKLTFRFSAPSLPAIEEDALHSIFAEIAARTGCPVLSCE